MSAKTQAPRPRTRRRRAAQKKSGSAASRGRAKPPTGGGPTAGAALVAAAARACSAAACGLWAGTRAGLSAFGRASSRVARSRDAQRVAVLALLGGAVVYASSEARARVARLPEFRIRHGAVGASAPPPGLSPAVLEDVRRLPLPREANAYDRRLIPFAAALLRELEWVADVRRVELVHPASLRFSLTPRRPLGRVVEGGRQCVLTDDGALISARYAADPERLPEVTGLPSPARPLARQRALAAAIDVLEDVAGLRARVLAVDLGALEGDPRRSAIRLRLEGDVDVAWGRPDTDERPHLPGESKRAALEEFLEQGPPLSSVATVSLRWDETVYVLRTPDARRGIDEHQLRGIR